jgi:hypothetical protein
MELPRPLKALWRGWMAFSHAIGTVMSAILLSVLWVVAFGAYAIILKIIKMFGDKKIPETYWWDSSAEVTDFTQQF